MREGESQSCAWVWGEEIEREKEREAISELRKRTKKERKERKDHKRKKMVKLTAENMSSKVGKVWNLIF